MVDWLELPPWVSRWPLLLLLLLLSLLRIRADAKGGVNILQREGVPVEAGVQRLAVVAAHFLDAALVHHILDILRPELLVRWLEMLALQLLGALPVR